MSCLSPLAPASSRPQLVATPTPSGVTSPMPVTTTRRVGRGATGSKGSALLTLEEPRHGAACVLKLRPLWMQLLHVVRVVWLGAAAEQVCGSRNPQGMELVLLLLQQLGELLPFHALIMLLEQLKSHPLGAQRPPPASAMAPAPASLAAGRALRL